MLIADACPDGRDRVLEALPGKARRSPGGSAAGPAADLGRPVAIHSTFGRPAALGRAELIGGFSGLSAI